MWTGSSASGPHVKGVITATRGNHGQSLAFACGRAGIACTVVVPFGNSAEKNAAMQAFGAELIEHGRDFDEARERAAEIAEERGYEYGKSFDKDLVLGVATYAHELFTAEPELDAVYVPIGLGSGICGVIGARDALGRKARVIGVVSDRANTYRLSLDAGRPVPTNSARPSRTAWRCAFRTRRRSRSSGAAWQRLIEVTDDEIAEAIRVLYTDTHTLAEGAGAAALRGADAGARDAAGQARRRGRVGPEHRPALDGDRARRRHAAGRVRRSDAYGGHATREDAPREFRAGDQRQHALFRLIPD